MRVALLSYRSKEHVGGQGVYVRYLAKGLADLGHDVELFSGQPYPETLDPRVTLTKVPSLDLYNDADPFRTPELSEYRDVIDMVEVGTMWTAGFPEPTTFSLRVAKLLAGRRAEYDVIHDNQCLGYGLLALEAQGFPVIATVHHPITHDKRLDVAETLAGLSFDKRSMKKLMRRVSLERWYGFLHMQKIVARRLPELLTVSQSSAEDISRDFSIPVERIRTVPLGVDTDRFAPPVAPRVPRRIVTIASADMPLKGVRYLLEAIAQLRHEYDLHLELVTKLNPDGGTAKRIERLGIGDIVHTQTGLSDTELATLIGSAEIMCVPSLYEGFSLPTVEGMSCGTPMLVTNAGAIPEVLGDDGVCGRIVPPGDSAALATGLRDLFDNPQLRETMGQRGRARAEEKFSWLSVAAETVKCYEDTIERAQILQSGALLTPQQAARQGIRGAITESLKGLRRADR